MKRKLSFAAFALLTYFSGSAWAQEMKRCGTTEMMRELARVHPEIATQQQQYDAKFNNLQVPLQGNMKMNGQVYIIPVVFHIVHNYGPENISDAQVLDQMAILNRDFRKLNADTSAIAIPFKGIAADCEIEFRLAQKDPWGNCTNGIDRVVSHKTYNANDEAKLNRWPRDKYLNIWVVNTIGANGVAGYAYYPGAVAHGMIAWYDGILILHDYIGSMGTSTPSHSRSLTHEIGHYLNLQHTWGNTNDPEVACGDDNVQDTPETKGHMYDCNLNDQECNPGIVENVQNFMEYAYCSNMYTQGQKTRMQTALNFSDGDRNNLWTQANLAFTGTDGAPPLACAPVADFTSNALMACEGAQVYFQDVSYNGSVSSRSWSLADGTPSSSTQAAPVSTFHSPGWKDISLSVSNGAGSDAVSKHQYLFISPKYSQVSGLYSEGFEDKDEYDNNWIVYNRFNQTTRWSRTSYAGYNGSWSVMLNNFNSDNGDIDELVSPSFDLRYINSPVLSFRLSCATTQLNAAAVTDELTVYSSVDCGATWQKRASYTGPGVAAANLVNAGYAGSFFIPGSADWTYKTISIPTSVKKSYVRFMFEFRGTATGNNLYLDDINISGTLGVEDPSLAFSGLMVFPNPSAQDVTLSYSLKENGPVKAELYDAFGRQVKVCLDEVQAAGDHVTTIQRAGIAKGIYLVKLTAGSSISTRKLILE